MASLLVIGPHPDDQELGMGGSIARLAAQGHRVHLVDMTNGEPTPLGTPEIRAKEAAAAAKVLGVERMLLGLPNRQVVHSIEARHKLAAVIRIHQPDWMFLPFPIDAHPDHVAVTRIGEDARFDAKLGKTDIPGPPWYPKRIIYYYCTHLRMNFQPTFCLDISAQIEQKIAAVRCYDSQFIANHSPVIEMVKTMNGYFGGRIGVAYAEPFFTYEALGFAGLDQLVQKQAMIADASWVYIILVRWVHVLSACLLVGATFFLAVILPAATRAVDPQAGAAVRLRTRRVFKMLCHTLILLLLASGIYNAFGNWRAYHGNMPLTHALFGSHVLLAIAIFVILLVILSGQETKPRHRTWLRVVVVLLFLTVLVASSLKWAREHPRQRVGRVER